MIDPLLPTAPQDSAYPSNLVRLTIYGALTGAAFQLFYALLYWLDNFPQAALFNLIGGLIDLACLPLVHFTRFKRLAANLVVFSLYASLLGVSIFSGAGEASSMPWLAFVPAAATLIAGRNTGLVWGILSIAATIVMYLLNDFLAPFNVRPSAGADYMVDTVGLILVFGIAMWLSETAKLNVLQKLEQAHERMRYLAQVDPLTAIYNRRYFFERATSVLAEMQAALQPFAIILCDIDHFKKVNDNFGHLVGDQILSRLIPLCRKHLRQTDILARYGGEEFIILLPNTTFESAEKIAWRLCQEVENTPIETDFGSVPLTISLGVTASDAESTPIDALLMGADQALYRAKQSGRNRVVAGNAISAETTPKNESQI